VLRRVSARGHGMAALAGEGIQWFKRTFPVTILPGLSIDKTAEIQLSLLY